jgi:hypothetical protein
MQQLLTAGSDSFDVFWEIVSKRRCRPGQGGHYADISSHRRGLAIQNQDDASGRFRSGIMPTSARVDAGWRFRIKMMLQDDSEGRHQLASTRAGDSESR